MPVGVRRLILAGAVSLSILVGILGLASPAAQAKLENPLLSQFPAGCGVSVDPASQDVYVAGGEGGIAIFNSAGVFQSQITGASTPAGRFSFETCSTAVNDKTGDVYIKAGSVVYVFNALGSYLTTIEGSETPQESFEERVLAVAVDQRSGDVYVLAGNSSVNGSGFFGSFVDRFNPEGKFLSQIKVEARGLAIDAKGNVYISAVKNGGDAGVDEFNSSGSQIAHLSLPQSQVGSASTESYESRSGLAVDSAGNVYLDVVTEEDTVVAENEGHPAYSTVTIDEFDSSGVLRAEIKPIGNEFVLEGSHQVKGMAVNAAGDLYVDGGGGGKVYGPLVNVPTPPSIDVESVEGVTATAATVTAQVNPNEEETAAYVEYGPTSSYGSSTVAAAQHLGSGLFDATASTVLSGLAPEATYHYRVVAVNASHETTYGADKVFTTYSVSSGHFTLPDDRSYELVSPAEKYGDSGVFPLDFQGALIGSSDDQVTESSANGEAVAYVGEPFFQSRNGEASNQYVSVRTAGGWSTENVRPEDSNASAVNRSAGTGYVVGFSPDLSAEVVQNDLSLGSGGPLNDEYEDLWLRDGGGPYRPLVDEQAFAFSTRIKEPNVVVGGHTDEFGFRADPNFAGASADFSHIIFEAHDTLTEEARPVGGSSNDGTGGNLYEWVDGQLSLINVLPSGGTEPGGFGAGAAADIGAGGSPLEYHRGHVPNLSNVISSDGTRVFWSTVECVGECSEVKEEPAYAAKDLYVRENAGTSSARTVQVDKAVGGGGQYWTASSDGSLVFFTKEGHLYQFDTVTHTTSDLTPGGTVEGVMGASEDGSYVYFVASGALAPGGAVAGQPNLYLSHEGDTTFIATLSPSDDELARVSDVGTSGKVGDWKPVLAKRTARVSPDGHYLAFLSVKSLTGYENRGAIELFRYSTEANQLVCASCVPSGAQPTNGGIAINGNYSMWTTPAVNGIYQQRYLLNDGRVLFDSNEALVPQDTNGTTDVYEYESGHMYLISPGTGGPSSFADASENGDNVFFTTANQLVPEDQDQVVDIYDARVGGGFRAPPSTECTGTGCQGVPPVPPIFATPSSVTFEGVGNFLVSSMPAKAKAKVKHKAGRKSKKGKRGRKGRTAGSRGKGKKASAKRGGAR